MDGFRHSFTNMRELVQRRLRVSSLELLDGCLWLRLTGLLEGLECLQLFNSYCGMALIEMRFPKGLFQN